MTSVDVAIPAGDLLTPREIEIMELVAQGCCNREIGERFFLSENTIKTHRRRIAGRLGARNSYHALALALRLGYLPVDAGRVAARPLSDPDPSDELLAAHLREIAGKLREVHGALLARSIDDV